MGNEDCGESSQSNDNNDLERPLKKAKYVWQVKGKYHLKANCDKPKPKEETLKSKTSCECSEQNIREERKCIDRFLAKTESFLDSDDDENVSKNIDKSILNEIPVTLVTPNPKNQDYYLRKWQARQIARGYIDNTINRVLENWASAPFDIEDFVENCDDDGRIENQGILMAIEAHGLQSSKAKNEHPLAFLRPDELADSTLDKIDTARSQFLRQGLGLRAPEGKPNDTDLEAELGLGVEYPVNVLNAAILVAIERKGLTSNK